MDSNAVELLKAIVSERELTYRAAAAHLSRRFGDYRDFYPLATLFTAGYIDATVDKSKLAEDSRLAASYFWAMTRGTGRHTCNQFTAINDDETDRRNIVFATAKADMYLSERRERRMDLLASLAVAILVAIFSALFARWIGA